MTWTHRIRVFHRWVSIVFTLGFLANLAAWALPEPPVWLGLFALVPLLALMTTGLWLFATPYLQRS